MDNDLKIKDLAFQLAALSGDDALNLLDAIAAVTAKAEAARIERAEAEAEAERNRRDGVFHAIRRESWPAPQVQR